MFRQCIECSVSQLNSKEMQCTKYVISEDLLLQIQPQYHSHCILYHVSYTSLHNIIIYVHLHKYIAVHLLKYAIVQLCCYNLHSVCNDEQLCQYYYKPNNDQNDTYDTTNCSSNVEVECYSTISPGRFKFSSA